MRRVKVIRLKLREVREKRGWNQSELAKRAGLTHQCINLVETRLSDIRLSTLARCCLALGIKDFNELLEIRDVETDNPDRLPNEIPLNEIAEAVA